MKTKRHQIKKTAQDKGAVWKRCLNWGEGSLKFKSKEDLCSSIQFFIFLSHANFVKSRMMNFQCLPLPVCWFAFWFTWWPSVPRGGLFSGFLLWAPGACWFGASLPMAPARFIEVWSTWSSKKTGKKRI